MLSLLSEFPSIIPHAVSDQLHKQILATNFITLESVAILCNELFQGYIEENFSFFKKVTVVKRNCTRKNISRFFLSLWKEYQTRITNADQAQLCEITICSAEGHMIMALRISFTHCQTNLSHSIQATGYKSALMSCSKFVECEAGLYSSWFSLDMPKRGNYLLCCEIAYDEKELKGREMLDGLHLKKHIRDLGFVLENVP